MLLPENNPFDFLKDTHWYPETVQSNGRKVSLESHKPAISQLGAFEAQ